MIDEFRIYSAALSPAETAATYALGSNQMLSTNSPTAAFSTSANNLTLSWPLASAGFTLQSRTNLTSGTWEAVTSPAPQMIGGQWQVTLPQYGNREATYYRLLK